MTISASQTRATMDDKTFLLDAVVERDTVRQWGDRSARRESAAGREIVA